MLLAADVPGTQLASSWSTTAVRRAAELRTPGVVRVAATGFLPWGYGATDPPWYRVAAGLPRSHGTGLSAPRLGPRLCLCPASVRIADLDSGAEVGTRRTRPAVRPGGKPRPTPMAHHHRLT